MTSCTHETSFLNVFFETLKKYYLKNGIWRESASIDIVFTRKITRQLK